MDGHHARTHHVLDIDLHLPLSTKVISFSSIFSLLEEEEEEEEGGKMSPPTPRMVWFGRHLIGREISIPEYHNHDHNCHHHPSNTTTTTWRLDEKVREKYAQENERTFKEINYTSQAWAVYLCSRAGL